MSTHIDDSRIATIVVDLGYGDSGKGGMTDWLCDAYGANLVVRFNGGSQAAHGVTTPDGRRHVFSQFGSGTLVPGVRTVLSKHMLVSPLAMMAEAARLREIGVPDAFARTSISEEALVITLFHRAANRLREIARGDGRHGSCGHGVGETASDAIAHGDEAVRMRDLNRSGLVHRLRLIQERKRAELADVIKTCKRCPAAGADLLYLEDPSVPETWAARLRPFLAEARVRTEDSIRTDVLTPDRVVFEGAQGVLLDEWRGFHPYTTWSTCTFDNALGLLEDYGWTDPVAKMGVIRAYATRHGAGPFPTEDAEMTRTLPDSDNAMNDWQRGFRVGWLDLVAIRYAIAACDGIDSLAVTCLDRLASFKDWKVCDGYQTPDGLMNDLPLGPRKDLVHQERLTALLAKARPTFRVTNAGSKPRFKAMDHALAIREGLGCPGKPLILSIGPTSKDKSLVP